ncbi:hypothetical protein K1719_044192 [Acacia pycnantha]|nr:hypothetical protein K1719_044192 [Acacia pycnantha]
MRVYSSLVKLQVYVFSNTDDFKSLLEPLQDVARTFKSKVVALTYVHCSSESKSTRALPPPSVEITRRRSINATIVVYVKEGTDDDKEKLSFNSETVWFLVSLENR